MSSQQRNLFGDTITFSIPPRCIDVSEIRQVPDNQEVFLYPDSPISIIVEVLERVAENDDEEAAKFHFSSLAGDNSAASSSIERVSRIPGDRGGDTPSPIVLHGTQLVHKFNSAVLDTVRIFLAVFRIKSKNVDLVLSMNVPLETVEGRVDDTKYQLDFDTAVKSLHVLDFGLFV